MNISKETLDEARGIAEALDKRIRKMRAAGETPTVSDLLRVGRIQRMLDEVYMEFEREMEARAEWDSHRNDGVDITEEDREIIGY